MNVFFCYTLVNCKENLRAQLGIEYRMARVLNPTRYWTLIWNKVVHLMLWAGPKRVKFIDDPIRDHTYHLKEQSCWGTAPSFCQFLAHSSRSHDSTETTIELSLFASRSGAPLKSAEGRGGHEAEEEGESRIGEAEHRSVDRKRWWRFAWTRPMWPRSWSASASSSECAAPTSMISHPRWAT